MRRRVITMFVKSMDAKSFADRVLADLVMVTGR